MGSPTKSLTILALTIVFSAIFVTPLPAELLLLKAAPRIQHEFIRLSDLTNGDDLPKNKKINVVFLGHIYTFGGQKNIKLY